MKREQILSIIQNQLENISWRMEEALPYLESLGFTPEKVEGNSLFGEHKIRMTIEMAYRAYEEEVALKE
ncbi:hypothetical protein SMD22_00790 (plasmid) [Brevibacillus halotolerans]|nr:hypothetical protein SMD22_00790 [Brevibacillus halotolerans]